MASNDQRLHPPRDDVQLARHVRRGERLHDVARLRVRHRLGRRAEQRPLHAPERRRPCDRLHAQDAVGAALEERIHQLELAERLGLVALGGGGRAGELVEEEEDAQLGDEVGRAQRVEQQVPAAAQVVEAVDGDRARRGGITERDAQPASHLVRPRAHRVGRPREAVAAVGARHAVQGRERGERGEVGVVERRQLLVARALPGVGLEGREALAQRVRRDALGDEVAEEPVHGVEEAALAARGAERRQADARGRAPEQRAPLEEGERREVAGEQRGELGEDDERLSHPPRAAGGGGALLDLVADAALAHGEQRQRRGRPAGDAERPGGDAQQRLGVARVDEDQVGHGARGRGSGRGPGAGAASRGRVRGGSDGRQGRATRDNHVFPGRPVQVGDPPDLRFRRIITFWRRHSFTRAAMPGPRARQLDNTRLDGWTGRIARAVRPAQTALASMYRMDDDLRLGPQSGVGR